MTDALAPWYATSDEGAVEIRRPPTRPELQAALYTAAEYRNALQWVIAALLNGAERWFGEAEAVGERAEVARRLGRHEKTLQNWQAVQRRWGRPQHAGLRFGHYEAVSGLDDAAALALLRQAESEAWPVEELRQRVRAAKALPGGEPERCPTCGRLMNRE